MIELHDVAMSYSLEQSQLQVLDGACLSVAQGDTVAIVGPSGSGKTTMLVLLAGLEQPQNGDILIDGVALSELDVDALADLRRDRLGIIFQSFHHRCSSLGLGGRKESSSFFTSGLITGCRFYDQVCHCSRRYGHWTIFALAGLAKRTPL